MSGNSANGGAASLNSGPTFGGSAYGGAIWGKVALLNVTLSSNSVQVGSGITNYPVSSLGAPVSMGSSIYGDVVLTNTILDCAQGQTNLWGSVKDGGHNISSDASTMLTSPTSRNRVDPLLGPPTDNGGLTPTCALSPLSPAIDAADNSMSPATDQRGVPRPQGFGYDIGAFELAPELSLTRGETSKFQLRYVFLPGVTNLVKGSTNLTQWAPLAIRISDALGEFVYEDEDSTQLLWRFYQVTPK